MMLSDCFNSLDVKKDRDFNGSLLLTNPWKIFFTTNSLSFFSPHVLHSIQHFQFGHHFIWNFLSLTAMGGLKEEKEIFVKYKHYIFDSCHL